MKHLVALTRTNDPRAQLAELVGFATTLNAEARQMYLIADADEMTALQRQFVRAGQVVGHDDLGHQDAAGSGHEGCGEKIGQIGLAQQARVSGEDGAGHARHADGHHREQAGRGQSGEVWADDERGFRLADEDVGRGTQRFHAADARDPADRSADPAHDPLHDA